LSFFERIKAREEAAFLKKAAQKNLLLYSRDVGSALGGDSKKSFCFFFFTSEKEVLPLLS
jgi:hypothetical protein